MAAASAGALPMMMISAAAPSAAAVAAVDDWVQVRWGLVRICTRGAAEAFVQNRRRPSAAAPSNPPETSADAT